MKTSYLSRMLRIKTLLILLAILLLALFLSFFRYHYFCYQLRFQDYGDVSALPFLLEHLESEDPVIRANAVGGISTIGPAAKNCTPILIEALKDEDPMVVMYVTHALGSVSNDSDVAAIALTETLNHDDKVIQAYSAAALAIFGRRARVAKPILIEKCEDPSIAAFAARALGAIGDRDVIPLLTKLSLDSELSAQAEAVSALKNLRPLPEEIRKQLRPLLHDSDERLASEAAELLNTD